MGKLTLNGHFHSYVSLPEGIPPVSLDEPSHAIDLPLANISSAEKPSGILQPIICQKLHIVTSVAGV
jgi:hypothetical protein